MKNPEKPEYPQKAYRPKSILDPNFKYVPAAQTDITQIWRKHGWKPIERMEKPYEGRP